MTDARFEDGAEQAVRLRAEAPEDLAVISALVQDALGQTARVAWMPKRRRFSALLGRFRWEDAPAAERQGRTFERVQALLTVDSALRTRANGIDPRDPDLVISVLSVEFLPAGDGAGTVRIVLAGDGEIAIDVECLDVRLEDVTRPYAARAKAPPRHSGS